MTLAVKPKLTLSLDCASRASEHSASSICYPLRSPSSVPTAQRHSQLTNQPTVHPLHTSGLIRWVSTEHEPITCLKGADTNRWFAHSKYYVSFTQFRRLHVSLLNPTGHVMHQQFNIQQLYVLPTLYLCVLYLSENKQQLMPLTA